MVLRTDVAVIVIALAGGALWIEHGHRVVIDAPAADTAVSVAAACSDTDAVPYSTACLEYINVSSDTGRACRWSHHWQRRPHVRTPIGCPTARVALRS